MRCNYAMMSPSDTSLEEEEGADVDGIDRDRTEREGGATESIYCDLNCASTFNGSGVYGTHDKKMVETH